MRSQSLIHNHLLFLQISIAMPAQRPSASFEPISPDLDLAALVEETPNFEYVVRISCEMIESQGLEAFEKLVLLHVIIGGKPLVIEGFHNRLDSWTFTSQWLQDNVGKKCRSHSCGRGGSRVLTFCFLVEQARNLTEHQNMQLSIGHYLNNLANLTNQWNRYNYKEADRQRIYLKDIDCPQIWQDKLKDHIPPSVFYLSESTGDVGGPGSVDDRSRGIARAGDLMSCLPPPMRAENLMCYIGHEGTYTPAHREMCASLGHNLMVETSGATYENGKPTKPGSSIWFMTETKDRHLVSEYWLSTLGHDIEIEAHFAQINAWKAAPFNTYVVEQKVGDFILIPPLAPHQVWNRGTRTMKVAWNRTTVETLEMALDEALPRARMVCRDEQYKNKAIILFALDKYSKLLRRVDHLKEAAADPQVKLDLGYSSKIRQLQKDFKRLFSLYTRILISETLTPVPATEKGQYIPYDSNITCSYCRCNIFNRFLTCPTCIIPLENGEEDTYDICLECYAMGRSCRCNSGYKWVEQFPWSDLTQKHEAWRNQIVAFDGLNDKSPKPLHVERKDYKKKTLAQVCQEQLRERPWLDPNKDPPVPPSTLARRPPITEEQVNADGSVRKKKSTRNKDVVSQYPSCHVCQWPEFAWKLAFCSCGRGYCYGSLFRAFDLMPSRVMEDPDWKCPHCLRICSCAQCRKLKNAKPYEPTGTVLGYDTRKVADPRSWDSLVNYSVSNINWVKKAGDDHPHDTKRIRRRQNEADLAKSKDPALDADNYVDEDETTTAHCEPADETTPLPTDDGIPIDPMLFADTTPARRSFADADSEMEAPMSTPPMHQRNPTAALGLVFSRSIAPTAPMVEQHSEGGKIRSTDVNGITFEYPDSTLTQSGSPNVTRAGQPYAHDSRSDQLAGPEGNGILHSDLEVDTESAAQAYHQALLQQHKPKTNGSNQRNTGPTNRQGKSLLLRLRIDSRKLGLVKSRADGTEVRPEAKILQSDFPNGPQARSVKKRLTREEKDEDFSYRKRLKTAENKPQTRMSLPNMKPSQGSEDSSSELEEQAPPSNGFQPVNGTAQPRQLPAYLARRSLGSYDEPIQENSASSAPSKQRRGRPRKSQNSTPNNHQPQSANVGGAVSVTSQPTAQGRIEELPHNDDASITTDDAAVDAFPPKQPVPRSKTDTHLSKLGPGQAEEAAVPVGEPHESRTMTSGADEDSPSLDELDEFLPPIDEAARRAEENRKAKMRALMWAEGRSDEESDAVFDAY